MATISSEIIQIIDQNSQILAKELFNIIAPEALKIHSTMFYIWLLWQIIYKAIIKASLSLEQFLKTCFIFTATITILRNAKYYWDYFATPIYDICNSLIILIMQHNYKRSISIHTTYDVLNIIDNQITQVFDLCISAYSSSILLHPEVFVGAIIIHIPFLFLWVLFVCFILEFLFKMLAINALFPIFLILFGFNSTRTIPINCIKTVLHSCVTVVISVIAIALAMKIISTSLATIPISSGNIKDSAHTWLFSKQYWQCFLSAFIAILFQIKSSSIANSIMDLNIALNIYNYAANKITPNKGVT